MGLFAALPFLLLVYALAASLPSSYADITPEKIASLMGQIESLQAELEGLHSQLEDMQNNKTKAECDCEELEERLENLKSKLEEWEKAVNATSIKCDCAPNGPSDPLPIGDLAAGAIAGAAIYVGGVGGSFYGHRGLKMYLSNRAKSNEFVSASSGSAVASKTESGRQFKH